MNAIDTNVLIYSIDSRDTAKRQRALELIETLPDESTITPWQVACEVIAVLRKMERGGQFRGDLVESVTALHACFPIVVPSVTTLQRAIRLQVQEQISAWDAMLIAACADAGVTKLYTEDIQSRSRIEGIEIINPFADT